MVPNITDLIYQGIAAYALVFIIASSGLLEPLREYIKEKTPRLKIGSRKHFIECRMCVGFWVSLAVCLFCSNITDTLFVYGLSYFIATQER